MPEPAANPFQDGENVLTELNARDAAMRAWMNEQYAALSAAIGSGGGGGSGNVSSAFYDAVQQIVAEDYLLKRVVYDQATGSAANDRAFERTRWDVIAGDVSPASALKVYDEFSRTLAAGSVGSADIGGAWTIVTGGTRLSVGGALFSGALIATFTGANQDCILTLPATTWATQEVLINFEMDAVPSAVAYSIYLLLRHTGAGNDWYRVRLAIYPPGNSQGQLSLTPSAIVDNGAAVDTAAEYFVPGASLAANQRANLRVRISSTNPTVFRARYWLEGQTEPEWRVLGSDSQSATTRAPLQGAGAVGLHLRVSGSALPATPTMRVHRIIGFGY